MAQLKAPELSPAFVVYTDYGPFRVAGTAGERMGVLYAFFDKEEKSEMVPAPFLTRLFTGRRVVQKTRVVRHYRELFRFADIRRIVVPSDQVSA